MSIAESSGYLAAALVFITFYMKTMVPLRIIGICSNVAFILYGAMAGLYPVLLLHLVLLPLNVMRLRQMQTLTQQVRQAVHGGDHNVLEWLKAYGATRHVQQGDVVFRKGDVARAMFVVMSGRFQLSETGIELAPMHVVGEFAWLSPERGRTQSLVCVEPGTLLQVNYGQVEQLFFQNPRFGYYFLQLITKRLFQNIERLESELAQCRQALGRERPAG